MKKIKKFLFLITRGRGSHSLYACTILSAFLITNLYPPSLRASMRQNPMEEYLLLSQRDAIYKALSDEMKGLPLLSELFGNMESFTSRIIDNITDREQMSSPLIASLEELYASQELDRGQVPGIY